MVVSEKSFKDRDRLSISIDVNNTGPVTGKEIVQAYIHVQESSLKHPPNDLKGFSKVELNPGETKTVRITLDSRAFAFNDPGYGQWITEDGAFDILVGASSADIRCRETVHMQSTITLPCILDEESTMKEQLDDWRGAVVFGPIYEQ